MTSGEKLRNIADDAAPGLHAEAERAPSAIENAGSSMSAAIENAGSDKSAALENAGSDKSAALEKPGSSLGRVLENAGSGIGAAMENVSNDIGTAYSTLNAKAEELNEAARRATWSSRRFASGTPVVDYRKFRLSKLNDPEFSHLKLLGGWLVYFAMYFLTENFISEDRLHVIHCALDDMIPFNEYFAIFYCFWYLLIVISLLYFALYDIDSFKKLQIFIMVTQAIAMVIYIVYPSVQYMRPEVMPHDNIFCHLMEFIYRFDTPTGVFPSLHVAYSIGIASVWIKNKKTPLWWKVFVVFACVMISISVTFVKQHSALDVLLAIPVGMVAEHIVFGRFHAARRRLKRWRAKKTCKSKGLQNNLTGRIIGADSCTDTNPDNI